METPYFKMRREGDIICCEYTDNLHLTLEIAKDPLLVDMRGIRSVTKEARTYMASVGPILVKAGALIIGSVINRTNGNVFLAIDKPSRGCQTLHGRSQSKGMAAEIYPDKLAEKEKEHPS